MRHILHLFGMALLVSSGSALAAWDLNMPRGVTETSHIIYDLHMLILWICVAIGVVVFGVMFWSIYAHRKSKGAQAAQFHESTTVEIIWTIIPLAILIAMAVPSTTTLIDMYDTSESDIDIKVTGYQWKWHYDYINDDVDFFSVLKTSKEEIANEKEKNPHYLLDVDNELVVPVGKKVRFLFTANDVIHAWWVPEIAIKKDTIPGFINESWTRIEEPGIYRGQCAELCGKDHGFMPIVVKAVPQAEYDQWLADKKAASAAKAAESNRDWTLDELITAGEAIYQKNCAACHMPDGSGMPPAFPALNNSPMMQSDDPTDHLDVVINGVPGTAMSAYGKQMTEADLAAVITYKRNAWENKTGQLVSPADVKAFMNK
jgi:cytochrome c oxidase subunit 2